MYYKQQSATGFFAQFYRSIASAWHKAEHIPIVGADLNSQENVSQGLYMDRAGHHQRHDYRQDVHNWGYSACFAGHCFPLALGSDQNHRADYVQDLAHRVQNSKLRDAVAGD